MIASKANDHEGFYLLQTQTSELVPLPEFCAQQIIPELERPNSK